MSLGERIKKLREETLGISKKELAVRLGISQSAVHQWEKGINFPSQKRLIQLASLFNASYEWLVSGITKTEDDGSAIEVPFYEDICCSAGSGFVNHHEECLLISSHLIPLPSSVNFQNIIALKVDGDSMEPLISDMAIVLIDTSDKRIVDGKIYVYKQEDILRVKRLEYSVNGLIIKSINPEYADEKVTHQLFDSFCVIGRVLYCINKV
ncbi:LexA family transcriptional regulator [Vibrio parahaemolyticus]|nr:LexA family transcriptional regulator [Vibrio parahaemolyticus]